MTQELAVVPQCILQRGNKTVENILSVFVGIFCLSLLAQIAIPLPWTPVPITGQTFGVSLIALLWGRKRGFSTVLSYIILGGLGLPIFAFAKSGFSIGPTTGYLVGMITASYIVGTLSDMGWAKTWGRAYLAALLGSLVIFACGVAGLSFFVPAKGLLMAGVLPFLPGDLAKTLLASFLASRAQRIFQTR